MILRTNCNFQSVSKLPYEKIDSSATNSLKKIESLTFRNWWHLLARYTSTVESTDVVRTVLKIMAHRGFRHLPVVDRGNLLGIVSAGDLFELFTGNEPRPPTALDFSAKVESELAKDQGDNLLSSLHTPVSMITNFHPITVNPDNTILDAIRVVAEKNIGSLLILEGPNRGDIYGEVANPGRPNLDIQQKRVGGKLLGIVTLRDIVSILAAYGPFGVRIEDTMTRRVATVSEMDSIYSAMQLMNQHRVRRLPVLLGARNNIGKTIIGMVTNKMILRYLESVISYEMLDVESAIKQPLKTVMISSMPLIDPKEDCGNAAYLMKELGTGGFAVVDSEGLIGVITERDLIRGLYQRKGLSFFSSLFENGDARIQI